MPETFMLQIARQRVDAYKVGGENIIRDHHEAMVGAISPSRSAGNESSVRSGQTGGHCLDCEAYLQLGIEAFRWLVWVDQTIRKAVYSGGVEYDASVDEAVHQLFVGWLEPCDRAEQWVQRQQARGFRVDNLVEFRQCCEEVRAIVEALEDDSSLPDAMAKLRDRALDEYRDGETTEFLEGV